MADRDDVPESGSADPGAEQPAQERMKKVNLKGAPTAVPDSIPKLKVGLPPLTWVGKDLSRAVLVIMAGSILLLMGYLFYMEQKIGRDVAGAYAWALEASRSGWGLKELDRLERATRDLKLARISADRPMSEASLQNVAEVLRVAARLPGVPDAQREQLSRCIPLPTDASRNDVVDGCVDILERIQREAWATLATTNTTGIAGDFAGKLQEQRQGLHQFWIQAAQLILLNLLLPLLTALFGYIFGRQNGEWSEARSAE